MRDAERRLLRCIGGIDDELILEAATARFRPKRWGHLIALAACLVLVLTLPAFLNQNKGGPEAAPGYEPAESPESSNNKFAETEGVGGAATEGSSYELSLGGVKLGMTQQEVQVLLGEPSSMVDGGGYSEWKYDALTITFHDFNQTVWTVQAREGCHLKLPTGIGIDSSEDAVKEAYPNAMLGTSTPPEDGTPDAYYHLDGLTIGLSGGNVCEIRLYRTTDPMLDALSVNEITIYQWVDKQWQTTTVIDKAAKYICTVLTISEPEEATGEKDGVSMWMDFGNGTAVELLGGDRASVWTYTGDTFDPDKTDGLTYQIGGVFKDLDKYVAQALADPTATWDTDDWDNIIHEGDPESAPEAEP